MPNPVHLITGALTHPGKRVLTAMAAAVLLAAGLFAYSAANAPRARASTEVTGGLLVSVNPGSTDVGLATVSATVTYTCTDTSAPSGDAQLRVDFDQSGNDASGEVSVACGSGDVGETQTVTAVQLGMSGSEEITTAATLDDGDDVASSDDDTVSGQDYVHLDPTLTFAGDGTVTVTGFYNCASSVTPGVLVLDAGQDNSSTDVAAGSAVVPMTTCDGTDQSFSVTITSSNSGGSFVPDDPGVLLETGTTDTSQTSQTASVSGLNPGGQLATYI